MACGQILFSLSPGMGTAITMSSYTAPKEGTYTTAAERRIALKRCRSAPANDLSLIAWIVQVRGAQGASLTSWRV